MTTHTTKAGRMLLLYLLREDGVLNDVTQAEIARWLNRNRSTIHKDLDAIDATLTTYRQLLAEQPWVQRWWSTSEIAGVLGLDYDTTLAMIAGGVIRGERENQKAQWRVPVAEVQRWRRIFKRREQEDI
jgi:hypothetical protein